MTGMESTIAVELRRTVGGLHTEHAGPHGPGRCFPERGLENRVSCGWLRKEEGCEGEGLVQVAEEAGGIQLGVKRLRSYTTAVCEYCAWAFDNNKRQ